MTDSKIGLTAVTTQGDGPPVVLVHGLGLNRHMWQWQWDALTPHFKTVSYDLLGHGESEKPSGRVEMADAVAQLHAVIEGSGFDKTALVGFSLGGMIIRAYALAHPEKVSVLAILNSAHDRTAEERASIMLRVNQARENGPSATIEAALERWFTPGFGEKNPKLMDQIRTWVTANDKKVYPELYRLLAEEDEAIAKPISTIQAPTLVLTGEEDYGNSVEMAHGMAAVMPNAHAVILPKLRHMGLVEDPEAINRVVVPFLKGSLR